MDYFSDEGVHGTSKYRPKSQGILFLRDSGCLRKKGDLNPYL